VCCLFVGIWLWTVDSEQSWLRAVEQDLRAVNMGLETGKIVFCGRQSWKRQRLWRVLDDGGVTYMHRRVLPSLPRVVIIMHFVRDFSASQLQLWPVPQRTTTGHIPITSQCHCGNRLCVDCRWRTRRAWTITSQWRRALCCPQLPHSNGFFGLATVAHRTGMLTRMLNEEHAHDGK